MNIIPSIASHTYGQSECESHNDLNANNRYTSQKSIDLYVTTGTANDWFYGDDASKTNNGHRAYGFTIELRDTGL